MDCEHSSWWRRLCPFEHALRLGRHGGGSCLVACSLPHAWEFGLGHASPPLALTWSRLHFGLCIVAQRALGGSAAGQVAAREEAGPGEGTKLIGRRDWPRQGWSSRQRPQQQYLSLIRTGENRGSIWSPQTVGPFRIRWWWSFRSAL